MTTVGIVIGVIVAVCVVSWILGIAGRTSESTSDRVERYSSKHRNK